MLSGIMFDDVKKKLCRRKKMEKGISIPCQHVPINRIPVLFNFIKKMPDWVS